MDRSLTGSSLSRTFISPRKRPSMVQSFKKNNSTLSASGRSQQSVQVICRTANHLVESFGSSLPVLVTEALTFADRNTAVSVNVSEDGWAWLVCGRRLLVWQCKTTMHDVKQRRVYTTQCRELLLPQSDLAHKAECIAVWLSTGQQVPSCMAVSPEGVVRYWASIAHEGSSVETSAELAGQEVDCLTHVPGHGCILATTTCTVALLQPQFVSGKHNIACRVFRSSHYWLGGIGRRMSSLIFGNMPQSPVMETKLVKVTCTMLAEGGSKVLILAGNSLQYWSFPQNDQEKMEFDQDIGHMVSQVFQRNVLELSACNQQNMDTWLIDMQPCEEGIILLMAAHCSDQVQYHFAIGLIPLTGTNLGNSFKWFIRVKIDTPIFRTNAESIILSYRIILCGWEIILYNQFDVIVVNITSEHDQDKIDLVRGSEDSILGGALCSGTPVLFTKKSGLVSITQTDFSLQDFNTSYSDVTTAADYPQNISITTDNISHLVSNEDLQNMFQSTANDAQLRAAFIYSLRQNKMQCKKILMQLFPLQEEPVIDIDASLDILILKVAKDLIDDYPANDPRWLNFKDTSMTMNTITSMQIAHQLEGKQKALDFYLYFLKEHNLWDRLGAVTIRDSVMATPYVLGEYAEKIVAAISIHNLQNRYADIVHAIIQQTLDQHQNAILSDELTPCDIFYREVSAIHLFIPVLVNNTVEITQSERPVQQIAQYILQTNTILLGILNEVIKYRQYNAERFASLYSNEIAEYLPWTAAAGKHGLRNSLVTMQNLTLKYGIAGSDALIKNELYDQLVSIIDLILDGRKSHLESIRGTEKFDILLKQYESERLSLIEPLIKDELYENAAVLAEKYCDFASLIQICELTNNKKKLDSYIERYSSQNFVDFLFTKYLSDGKQGQLIERCKRGNGSIELTEKLSEHPSLAWIHAMLANDFRFAANTLHSIAIKEKELVTRKKTMLSLSKLALIASDCTNDEIIDCTQKINNELALIAHQEDLPSQVLQVYGYDMDKQKVLSPKELITLYSCNDNVVANEYDYKKALDLLEYVENNDEKTILRLKIWARVALRDKWDTVEKNPEEQIQKTMFFKLMELVNFMNGKDEEYLPPVDLLLQESELGSLATSSNFQYLVKLIYEYAGQNY